MNYRSAGRLDWITGLTNFLNFEHSTESLNLFNHILAPGEKLL